jgi:hypothetical protein
MTSCQGSRSRGSTSSPEARVSELSIALIQSKNISIQQNRLNDVYTSDLEIGIVPTAHDPPTLRGPHHQPTHQEKTAETLPANQLAYVSYRTPLNHTRHLCSATMSHTARPGNRTEPF